MILDIIVGFVGITLAIIYITPVSAFIILGFIYFILNSAFKESK